MLLYSFFRSSAAYRVRIALNLKGIKVEQHGVHLSRDGGAQNSPAFRKVNPQGRVPALQLDSGETLVQSMAILEYLEETHPNPPLLPADPVARAQVRGVANIIACDIHPLNNLVILGYLKNRLGADQEATDTWYRHWVTQGFEAIEALIGNGPYCFGDKVTLADVALVPQVFNARRFKTPMEKFPKIVAVDAALNALPAFQAAKPENQPDAE